MLNLAAAVERAGEFDIIHYEARTYPMSLAFTRLSAVADRPDAAPIRAGARPRWRLWSRYPGRRVCRHLDEQAKLLAGATSSPRCCTGSTPDRFAFNETPRDYLLFLGRSPRARAYFRRSPSPARGIRLVLAAAKTTIIVRKSHRTSTAFTWSIMARPIFRRR